MSTESPLVAPMTGTERRDIGGVRVDIGHAGPGRIRRLIYPPGFRWSTHVKPTVGTDLCMHAHVGFLAQGRIGIRFPDGCTRDYTAPAFVVIEPGHDGWIEGSEPAVLVEFDFEGDTASRFGLPASHRHG
ncbi:MAG: hypothetical protein H6Q08_247 [Acidobacteria bacterium]|nr:hypothetical protein [Acidobacteriota bacterium]